MRTAVIHLTWKRPQTYPRFLEMLDAQTVTDFDLFVSNANPEISNLIEGHSAPRRKYGVSVVRSYEDTSPFRRFTLARSLNYERCIFIDDDIVFPSNFIEECHRQYEPETYASWWAWAFNSRTDYWDRRRVTNAKGAVHYGGTGVSIVDSRAFGCPELFSLSSPRLKHVEDLWLSYIVSHVLGWRIKYLDIDGVSFAGEADDENALYKSLMYGKTEFYVDLVNRGWELR